MTTKVQTELIDLDPTLVALAGLSATGGLLAQIGEDTFAKRTLTGTADQITVTNGSGVAGNPTASLTVGPLVSSFYTPTLTNVANITSSTASTTRYFRIGPLVLVFGNVLLTPTAGGGAATTLGISLPIASGLGGHAVNLVGVANPQVTQGAARITGDVANTRASMTFPSSASTAVSYSFIFGYVITA